MVIHYQDTESTETTYNSSLYHLIQDTTKNSYVHLSLYMIACSIHACSIQHAMVCTSSTNNGCYSEYAANDTFRKSLCMVYISVAKEK